MRPYIVLLLCFIGFIWHGPCAGQSLKPPEHKENTIVVAAYNIKWLGQTQADLKKLAKVIQHFDVCGVIEIKRESELRDLRNHLEKLTGKKWGYVYGIRTHRPNGRYHEAYGALWRRDRVQLGDGVISNAWDLEEAFRNDPFFVSFKADQFDFTLMLVHTRWSKDAEGTREEEVAMTAEQVNWMRGNIHDKDIIVAGDFNFSGENPNMQAMADQASLEQVDPNAPSTYKPDGTKMLSPYDHIYLSPEDTTEFTGDSNVLDVTQVVYGRASASNRRKARKETSDHAPVWARFRTDQEDDD